MSGVRSGFGLTAEPTAYESSQVRGDGGVARPERRGGGDQISI